MNQTLFLIGLRGSGKTTLGKKLAKKMGYEFYDTDAYLLKNEQKTVTEIVESYGWDGFRDREHEALKAVTGSKRVIATGGGVILRQENRLFMRSQGQVFYLSAQVETLISRLKNSPNKAQRPSLTNLSYAEEVHALYKERLPLYLEAAHYTIKVNRPRVKIIEEIQMLYKKGANCYGLK